MRTLLFLALLVPPALAHDHWINGRHNGAGEWCCGEGDCVVVQAQHVTLPTSGWRLPSGEFVAQGVRLTGAPREP